MDKNEFFGRLGTRHDFQVTIEGIAQLGRDNFLEARNRQGRRLLIRITEMEEPVTVAINDTIFFRGQILSHAILFGVPFTFIETSSDISIVSPA